MNFIVNGKVTDISGEPLIGVNVFEKGTSNGTITNVDGRFSLNVSSNSTLTFSYIGYKTQEIIVGTQQAISVTLTEDSEQLEEVVVVGYGVQKKKNLYWCRRQYISSKDGKYCHSGNWE